MLSLKSIATQSLQTHLQKQLSNGSNLFDWLDLLDHYYGFRDLFDYIASLVCQHFVLLSSTEHFLAVDANRMRWIINNKKIVASEAYLVEALLKWFKHDWKNRKESFQEFFYLIDLEHIDNEYLTSVAKQEKLYDILPKLKAMTNKGMKQLFSLTKDKKKQDIEMAAKYSNVAVVGFLEDVVNDHAGEEVLGCVAKCWQPFVKREVAGAFKRKYMYDGLHLSEFPRVSEPLIIENNIYMLRFGFSHECQREAELTTLLEQFCHPDPKLKPIYYLFCYNIAEGTCRIQSVLETDDHCEFSFWPSLIQSGPYLYAITSTRDAQVLVNRYDTRNSREPGSWETRSPSKNLHKIYTQVVSFGIHKLYFIDENTECYDIFTDTWKSLSPMPEDMELMDVVHDGCYRAFAIGEQILVFRQREDNVCLPTLAYTPATDTWQTMRDRYPIDPTCDMSLVFGDRQFICAFDQSYTASFHALVPAEHSNVTKKLLFEEKQFFCFSFPQDFPPFYSAVALSRDAVHTVLKRSNSSSGSLSFGEYQSQFKFP